MIPNSLPVSTLPLESWTSNSTVITLGTIPISPAGGLYEILLLDISACVNIETVTSGVSEYTNSPVGCVEESVNRIV